MITKFTKLIDGHKTYIVALGMIIYAFLGRYLGQLTGQAEANYIWQGLTLIGVRSSIQKIINGLNN
jgi:hypothetical protein